MITPDTLWLGEILGEEGFTSELGRVRNRRTVRKRKARATLRMPATTIWRARTTPSEFHTIRVWFTCNLIRIKSSKQSLFFIYPDACFDRGLVFPIAETTGLRALAAPPRPAPSLEGPRTSTEKGCKTIHPAGALSVRTPTVMSDGSNKCLKWCTYRRFVHSNLPLFLCTNKF